MTRFMNIKIFTLLVFFLSAVVVISVLTIAGCSSANKASSIDVDTGKHVANWYFEHRVAYLTNPSQCYSCHGTDLHGGISGVSCFTFSFNGISCHANGPSGHPLGWDSPDSHGLAAKSTPNAAQGRGFSTCQICHGASFTGGQSNQTCLNTAGCHGLTVGSPHSPAPWRTIGGVGRTHTNTDTANAAVCALCHLSSTSSPPGCFNNTLCHAQVGHPLGWASPDIHGTAAKSTPNAGQGTGFSSCQTCHGASFTGGQSNKTCLNTAGCHGLTVGAPHSPAPWRGGTRTHTNTDTANAAVCALCHLSSTSSPPGCFNNTLCHTQVGVCGTCHAIPPDGAASPNTAGRHAVHTALAHVGTDCTVCHNGAGSGTGLHINGTAEVAFTTTYAAKPISGGTPSFNATANTCSNVSCHGGQTTPNWLTGTISVDTQCTLCHVSGTTQYNSYNSGQHTRSAHVSRGCTSCHDTALLAVNHFTNLNTTQMEGPASATIRLEVRYNGASCNPSAGGLTGCHGSENW